MSYEMSDFAKRLLAAGRGERDPEGATHERALTELLEKAQTGASVESANGRARGALARVLFGGAVVGLAAAALFLSRRETTNAVASAPSTTLQTAAAPEAPKVAPAATIDGAASAPSLTAGPAREAKRAAAAAVTTVTPDSLPSAATTVRPAAPAPAADLLREANQLRAQSRWADAAKKYEQVLQQRAESPEAYPARVALAKLALDHFHDAARALALYEKALAAAPRGGLVEEAEWGRARALKALGRRGEEQAALRAFVDAHPSSLLAGLAGERLKALENP